MKGVIASALKVYGLTEFHSFSVQRYNNVQTEERYRLPTFGRAETQALIIGNGQKIWPKFQDHVRHSLQSNSAFLETEKNPLDRYVEDCIIGSLKRVLPRTINRLSVHFANDVFISMSRAEGCTNMEIRDRSETVRMPFQRIGETCGFAAGIPGVGLQIIPSLGPWFAYRAVVTFDADWSETRMEDQDEDPSEWLNHRINTKDYIKQWKESAQSAISYNKENGWKPWLEIRRDIGLKLGCQDFEYSYTQIMYHYTKDKSFLLL